MDYMEPLEFTDDLSTGIIELDNQLKELFIWGNALLFSDELVTDTLDFADALGFLRRYVRYHFLSEEVVMKTYGYDRMDGHMKQHQRLKEDVMKLFDRVEKEGLIKGMKAELQYMFTDWYVYHIKEWDKDLASFLIKENEAESISMPKLEDLRKMDIPTDDISDTTVELVKLGGGFAAKE